MLLSQSKRFVWMKPLWGFLLFFYSRPGQSIPYLSRVNVAPVGPLTSMFFTWPPHPIVLLIYCIWCNLLTKNQHFVILLLLLARYYRKNTILVKGKRCPGGALDKHGSRFFSVRSCFSSGRCPLEKHHVGNANL
jgi:hypothetical protein